MSLVVLALGALGCSDEIAARTAEAEAAIPLRVERADLEQRVVLTGELVAERAAVVVAPVVPIWPLQVRWIVDDGIDVDRGDRIMEFDNAQLASRLEDERSSIIEARSRLDQTMARVASEEEEAGLELERRRAALRKAEINADLPEGLTSSKERAEKGKELEQARLERVQAETTLAAKGEGGAAAVADSRLALGGAQRALARTEASLERLVLRAPRSGMVVISEQWRENRAIRDGDQVWPGVTVARIPDLTTLVVHARLYDVDDGLVQPGMGVRATLDAFGGELFEGTVRKVEPIAQPVSSTSDRRAFHVVVDIGELDSKRMVHGMSVKLEVFLPPIDGELVVPRAALSWLSKEPHLRLADGRVTAVVLGACSTQRCVLEEGAAEGTLLGFGGFR